MKKILPVFLCLLFGISCGAYAETSVSDLTEQAGSFSKAKPILEESCLSCHSANGRRSFFSVIPGIRQLMNLERREALKMLDLGAYIGPEGKHVPPSVLTAIENSIHKGNMPPVRHRVTHWRSGLSQKEKKILLDWVRSQPR